VVRGRFDSGFCLFWICQKIRDQSVEHAFLNEITGYLYGPISGCENDIAALNMSCVHTQLLLLQEHVKQAVGNSESTIYFALFSNSVFPYHLCVTHKHEPPLGGELDVR
jgi:hypothetical protein